MTADSPNAPAHDMGFRSGMRTFLLDVPHDARLALGLDDLNLEILAAPGSGIDAAIMFVEDPARAERELAALRQLISPAGFIWIVREASADTDTARLRHISAHLGLAIAGECRLWDGRTAVKLMPGRDSPGPA